MEYNPVCASLEGTTVWFNIIIQLISSTAEQFIYLELTSNSIHVQADVYGTHLLSEQLFGHQFCFPAVWFSVKTWIKAAMIKRTITFSIYMKPISFILKDLRDSSVIVCGAFTMSHSTNQGLLNQLKKYEFTFTSWVQHQAKLHKYTTWKIDGLN